MAKRIMVINDTPEILDLFRELLETEGYEVILYSFAPFELTEIERLQPDLIVLDFIIGRANAGWQLLQMLKMRRATAAIPVVICSAQTHFVRQIEGYLATHDIRVVAKPFDIDELLTTIKLVFTDESPTARHLPTTHPRNKESDGPISKDTKGPSTPHDTN
ncbi:MAG: response regulator [Ktedonobacterales bacterium]